MKIVFGRISKAHSPFFQVLCKGTSEMFTSFLHCFSNVVFVRALLLAKGLLKAQMLEIYLVFVNENRGVDLTSFKKYCILIAILKAVYFLVQYGIGRSLKSLGCALPMW